MNYNPIKIAITPEMLQKAQERDKGQMNARSFMKGEGNLVGFLGEYMVQSVRSDFELIDDFNYDFISKGRKIDVKTKHQGVGFPPKGYYEVSVDVNSLHQNTDYYIFCRIYKWTSCVQYEKTEDYYPYGWILGGISKEDFMTQARRLKKGDIDGDNGYVVKQDCLNLRNDQLKPLKKK